MALPETVNLYEVISASNRFATQTDTDEKSHEQRAYADDERLEQQYRGYPPLAHAEGHIQRKFAVSALHEEAARVDDEQSENSRDKYARARDYGLEEAHHLVLSLRHTEHSRLSAYRVEDVEHGNADD